MIGGNYDPTQRPWDAVGEFDPDTGRVEWNSPEPVCGRLGDSDGGPYDWQSDGEFADRAVTGAEPTEEFVPFPKVDDWKDIARELQGITSAQLAVGVGDFINNAQLRVLGVGRQQYDEGDGQKFERLPLTELCDWALEELQDVAVYAAMLAIRIERIKRQFSGR